MKKNPIYLLMTLAAAVLITFSACQKVTEQSLASKLSSQSDDQSIFTNETDAVANDADIAIESSAALSGKAHNGSICDASWVIDSTSPVKSVTITYNGTNCKGNRTRNGVVVLSLAENAKWNDKGAVLTVKYQNLKITRVADKKSITFNGTVSVTNVSGGRVANLSSLSNIIHTINGEMTLTFSDGSKRVWNIARQRSYTYENGIVISVTGTHTDASTEGISEWGTDRMGNPFSTQISSPLIVRQDCDFRLTSGSIIHKTGIFPVTIKFGLDAAGTETSCPGAGHYNLKVEWMGLDSQPYSVILPY